MIKLFRTTYMLGLKKRCAMCGIGLEKELVIKKSGKHFCCTRHAEQYAEV